MISDDAFARTCPCEGERKATIRLELATSHATRENIIANFANRAANRNVEFPTSVANITKEKRKSGRCSMQRQFSKVSRSRGKNTRWSEKYCLHSRVKRRYLDPVNFYPRWGWLASSDEFVVSLLQLMELQRSNDGFFFPLRNITRGYFARESKWNNCNRKI